MMFRRVGFGLLIGALALAPVPAEAADVKIGILAGQTGPIESLVPPIVRAARLVAEHVNGAGGFPGGGQLSMPVADTACIDAAEAANAADGLINTENVIAIVGALCSSATLSAAETTAIPDEVVMVSPASTAPGLSDLDDNDLIFRVAPSDSYQGEAMARMIHRRGIGTIAIAHAQNAYGEGLAEAIRKGFEAEGGSVALVRAYGGHSIDFEAEIGALAATGADALVIADYVDGTGGPALRAAVASGTFSQFFGTDGMASDQLLAVPGVPVSALEGMVVTRTGNPLAPGRAAFETLMRAAGVDAAAPFVAEAYDSAFLLALAIARNGDNGRDGLAEALRSIASPPGHRILPGEWAEAMEHLNSGMDIDYEGAAGGHAFDAKGDVPGAIVEWVVKDGRLFEVGPAERP